MQHLFGYPKVMYKMIHNFCSGQDDVEQQSNPEYQRNPIFDAVWYLQDQTAKFSQCSISC
jgi:hypothetical protein